MNVRELQELLATLPPEAEVILAKGGDRYSPCADYSDQYRYEAGSTRSGELVSDPDARIADDGDTSPARWERAVPCVVLWPVN